MDVMRRKFPVPTPRFMSWERKIKEPQSQKFSYNEEEDKIISTVNMGAIKCFRGKEFLWSEDSKRTCF